MSDTPAGGLVTTHPNATLFTTFTALLEICERFIKDDDYRQLYVTAVPFIVSLILLILKNLYRRFKCREMIELHNSWISALLIERDTAHTYRKKEIDIEIKGYQDEIKKLQKSYIIIDFT